MHIYNAFSYLTVDFSKVTRARNKMAGIHVVVHTFKLTIHPYQYKKKKKHRRLGASFTQICTNFSPVTAYNSSSG